MEKETIFISYHEKSNKSTEIVKQLKSFFEEWVLDPVVIKWIDSEAPPRKIINQRLSSSTYLIQIFDDQLGPSAWMQLEWTLAEGFQDSQINPMKELIVLYTNQTDLNASGFAELKNKISSGRLRAINITSEDARTTLMGILKNTQKININVRGRIELPKCCKQSEPTKPIELSHVGEFIQNFSTANAKGLECVFPDRDAAQKKLIGRISSLHRDEKVSMLGFTLKRFVYPDNESKVGKAFKMAIDQGAKARLLLLDLTCRAAKERNDIESPGMAPDEGLLGRDSSLVSSYWLGNDNVEIKYYKTPYIGMILFNDQVFVEIYHLGKQIEDQGICGRVPIMIFREIPKDHQERETLKRDPDFYELFSSHFETVWSPS